jgi:hypothetical protein
MGFETRIEWREFRSEIRRWISEHPDEARCFMEEALSELSSAPTTVTVVTVTQWASRWAREFWHAVGIEPPRR